MSQSAHMVQTHKTTNNRNAELLLQVLTLGIILFYLNDLINITFFRMYVTLRLTLLNERPAQTANIFVFTV